MTEPAKSKPRKRSTRWNKTAALWLIILVGASWPSPSWPASFSDKYDAQIQSAVKRWWPDIPYWKLWKAQLYQESRLDPGAISPVGARGLAQFMPGTWTEIAGDMGLIGGPQDDIAIEAGAFYMMKLRRVWTAKRTALQRHRLAQASYNAGTGNILKAQRRCHDARLWQDIKSCLPCVTGENARETITYVERIAKWWHLMELQ